VADRDGVILSAQSDRSLVDPVVRARLVEGARWGEETRGTNAIGTALVEGSSVGVVGNAHFEVRNRDLFCYATPVRDAYGAIVAVLDVSGPLSNHDQAIGGAVQRAGAMLERALHSVPYADGRRGPFSAIERLVLRATEATILIEASGALRVVNAAARAAFAPGLAETSCERLFGMSFQELLNESARRGGMRIETRMGSWRLAVEPITGVEQRTLAALVHFEAERASAARLAEPNPSSPARSTAPEFEPILGRDPKLVEAKQFAARLARTSLPVLLLAETGTGKELFARAIHAASAARSGAFVAVNCGALAPELMLSELFGYAPGAFTGAMRAGSQGRIGAAHGGTLFLDEIAEMSDALQAALLRVLDSGVYQRVGESRERRAEFRLICATCRDLPALVDAGKFRRDLFYRVHGARLMIPTLRARTDVGWLAERLIQQLEPQAAPSLSEGARRFIAEHTWPGNVRELRSALGHALALAAGAAQLEADHFPEPLLMPPPAPASAPVHSAHAAPISQTRQRIVRDAIEATLRACAGNVSEAARRLRVGRGTIYRTLRSKKT